MKKEAALKILTDLIAIPSVNGREAEVADYLTQLFTNQNAQVERVTYTSGRDNLVVTIGDHGPILGLSGHEDVVAASDDKDWRYPPFVGTIANDKVYGRGASDMKSGLAAMVVAMLDLLASGEPLPGRIRLLATVGEETGEYGAAQLVKAGYLNKLSGVVIGEATDFNVQVAHKGVIDYRIDSQGKSAHASRPESGQNAILPLIQFVEQAQTRLAKDNHLDDELGGLTHVISQIHGGSQINSVPAQAWLTGNIRTIPAYPNAIIMQQLEDIVQQLNQQGAKLKISYSYPEPPFPSQKDTTLAILASQLLKTKFKRGGQFVAGTGASEASEYYKVPHLPIIIVGPAEEALNHQANEYIKINDYLLGCQFYRQLAQEFWQQNK